jgi:hypothetical protein
MKQTFVVGCPRAGTTIVQAMLARHPAVLSLPGTAFFERMYGDLASRWGDAHANRQPPRLRQRLGLSRKHERQLLRDLQRLAPAAPSTLVRPSLSRQRLQQRFIRLLDLLGEAAGCDMWLEQSPGHLLYLPEIEALVPNARFVHVVRPGADVIASLLDAGLLSERDDAFGGGTVRWSRRWNRAMKIHGQYLGHPRHYLLFLEDLIEQPQREWKRLCQFLDLDPARSGDADCTQAIADLDQAPWKRLAPKGKADALLGAKAQRRLQTRLASYEALRAQCLHMLGTQEQRRADRRLAALSGG